MKVLLDENLPHDLRHLLSGHDVYTVAYKGWSGLENGALLKAAAGDQFDVMLTKDSGVEFQQHLPDLPLAIIVIKAPTNKIDDIRPLLPKILAALASLQARSLVRVG
jgi:predicted nuclease of predicted toxin-antitoxin system